MLYFSSNSLTVTDSDGAQNSTQAMLLVNKATDYRPTANAGPNQVITLPRNYITLYGNQSTDDHENLSYEWSLSSESKGKVVEMQVLEKHNGILNAVYYVCQWISEHTFVLFSIGCEDAHSAAVCHAGG